MTDSIHDQPVDTVYILGAGASVADGAPVLNRFIDHIHAFVLGKGTDQDRDDFARFLRAYRVLQRTAAKANLDLYNLESIWTCLEMARDIGLDIDIGPDRLNDVLNSIKTLMCRSLALGMKYSLEPVSVRNGKNSTNYCIPCCKTYSKFVGSCKPTSSFITFNYDIGIDLALLLRFGCVDYGWSRHVDPVLRDNARNSAEQTCRLHKMHGSINWTTDVDINRSPVRLGEARKDRILLPSAETWPKSGDSSYEELAVTFVRNSISTAGSQGIVPPGEWKAATRVGEIMRGIWNRAAIDIRNARRVVFIGYSLPSTDHFFRSFFSLASVSDMMYDSVVVIDPSKSAHEHIESVLSTNLRNRLKTFSMTLERVVNTSIYERDQDINKAINAMF
jgi:hypothetical protein